MGNDHKKPTDGLEEEINDRILEATDEEILQDATEAGDDTSAFTTRMRDWLEKEMPEAGKRRLSGARAAVDRDQQDREARSAMRRQVPANDNPGRGAIDTMAARHERAAMSERDNKSLDEDIEELLDDGAWGDEGDDGD